MSDNDQFITCPVCRFQVKSPGPGKDCRCIRCGCAIHVDDADEPTTDQQPLDSAEAQSEETIIVNCPNCHIGLDVPLRAERYKCEYCGQEISLNYLDDNEDEGSTHGDAVNPSTVSQDDEHTWQVSYKAPFLENWKPSIGFSILGIVLTLVWAGAGGVIVSAFAELAFPLLPHQYTSQLAIGINVFIYQAASLFYAVKIYPSYFTKKPKIKSSQAASCLNFLFGPVIFGLFWSYSLSSRKKTRANTVFIILTGLTICQMAVGLCLSIPQYIAANNDALISASSDTTVNRSQMDALSSKPSSFVSEEGGFSADFPSSPEFESGTREIMGWEVKFDNWVSADDASFYLVGVLTYPNDFSPLSNSDAVNGGLSAALVNLCSSFDVPKDSTEIHYDDFLGHPSAYTSFLFEGQMVMGRSLAKDNKFYVIAASSPAEKQSETFISSFKLL